MIGFALTSLFVGTGLGVGLVLADAGIKGFHSFKVLANAFRTMSNDPRFHASHEARSGLRHSVSIAIAGGL